jgi:transcriptional regulator with XRE-family HTH domain
MKNLANNEMGDRIKVRLRAKNWNQSDLARACKLGRDSISTYISGSVHPSPKNLAKIANALACNPTDLVPDYLLPNDGAVMEMTKLNGGKMRLKIVQSVDLEKALQVFHILNA